MRASPCLSGEVAECCAALCFYPRLVRPADDCLARTVRTPATRHHAMAPLSALSAALPLCAALLCLTLLSFPHSLASASPFGAPLTPRGAHTAAYARAGAGSPASSAAAEFDASVSKAHALSLCLNQQDFDLSGVWVKHDRAVVEVFHINVTCVANCLDVERCVADKMAAAPTAPPSYIAYYLDGALAGHNTWNVSSVGDLMSACGTYNNFADDSGSQACPAPFSIIFEDDTNVVLVSYGATYGSACGDYTGDSARYYRQSALE